MNYLAHAYLSFNNTGLLTGNMISDFVKGKKQYDYPENIQAGIKLHRAIDEFTDSHAATQEIKVFFRPGYRLYAGAFADVVYDHFLANDEREFYSPHHLKQFTLRTYHSLELQAAYFPAGFAGIFPYMRAQDWLSHYRFDEGMEKSFGGLKRRAAYITETETAYEIFLTHKKMIKECYDNFFPDLKAFATHKSEQLLKK